MQHLPKDLLRYFCHYLEASPILALSLSNKHCSMIIQESRYQARIRRRLRRRGTAYERMTNYNPSGYLEGPCYCYDNSHLVHYVDMYNGYVHGNYLRWNEDYRHLNELIFCHHGKPHGPFLYGYRRSTENTTMHEIAIYDHGKLVKCNDDAFLYQVDTIISRVNVSMFRD